MSTTFVTLDDSGGLAWWRCSRNSSSNKKEVLWLRLQSLPTRIL
jgi:hypothetical protein